MSRSSDEKHVWFVEKFYGHNTGWAPLWLDACVKLQYAVERAMGRKKCWPKERLRVARYCRDVAVGITKSGLRKGNPV